MQKTGFTTQRKIFGGTNFVIVLWTLISILRLAISLKGGFEAGTISQDLFTYMVPLFFLALLNIFIGITLFLPQKKNKMWVISLIIVTATLVLLNTFQTKIEKINNPDDSNYKVVEY